MIGGKALTVLLVGMMMSVGGMCAMDAMEEDADEEAPSSRVLPMQSLIYIEKPLQPVKGYLDQRDAPNAEDLYDSWASLAGDHQGKDGVVIRWYGTDGSEGSGVESYDVQVRYEVDGEWSDWRSGTTETKGMFYPTKEGNYYFRCRATDGVGNVEDWPGAADAFFTVRILDPASVINGDNGPDLPSVGGFID